MEPVVGRHLVRFGTREELVVAWQRKTEHQARRECKSRTERHST